MDLARVAADWLPNALKPSLARLAARLGGPAYVPPIRWVGDYASYAEARAVSGGYETTEILEATVKRASISPAHTEQPLELTAQQARLVVGLLRPLLTLSRPSRILDFGGALGWHFEQMRAVLPDSVELDWIVWETPTTVAAASRIPGHPSLRFITDAAELGDWTPDAIVTSAALHYVKDPYAAFSNLAALGADTVVIDRMPLTGDQRDRLTVQHVAPPIYRASYPAWFLAEGRWISHLRQQYRVVMRWEGPETVILDKARIAYRGFVLRRLELT